MRHSLLYTKAAGGYSWLQLLQTILELQQILQTEVSSACSRKDERIGSRQISPAGRQKAHASVLVAVINTLLAPLPAVGNQLQCLPIERMIRMGYVETLVRTARLKRI